MKTVETLESVQKETIKYQAETIALKTETIAEHKETARLLRVELFTTRRDLIKATADNEWLRELVMQKNKTIQNLTHRIEALEGWPELAIDLLSGKK